MVKTFVCPADAPVPTGLLDRGEKKRERPAQADGEPGRRTDHKHQQNKKLKTGLPEISDIMTEIREFSSSTFRGQAKMKHKDDKLVRLGALPKAQQTLPLKMALGIQRGREKREAKALLRSKQSGTILAQPRKDSKDKDRSGGGGGSRDQDEPKRRRGLDVAPDIDVGAKRGVLHLSRAKLPSKLVNRGMAAAKKSGGGGGGGRGGGRGGGGRGGGRGGGGGGGRGGGGRRN